MNSYKKISAELEATNYIDPNGEFNDWEMFGRWSEVNEEGLPDQFVIKLAWDYIESRIEINLEKLSPGKLIEMTRDAFNTNKFSSHFSYLLENDEEMDFFDISLLIEYVKSDLVKFASEDYWKKINDADRDEFYGMKLFYNPIWIPTEVEIQLFSCYIPIDVEINDLETLFIYLEKRYRDMILTCYEEYTDELFVKYNQIIKQHFENENQQNLVKYLFSSDKFTYQRKKLENRIALNQIPRHNIG